MPGWRPSRNAWTGARSAWGSCPFLALGAYLADAPLPVPSILLSERRYLAFGRGVEPARMQAARGRGEAFAVLPDRLVALPETGAVWQRCVPPSRRRPA